MKDAVHAPGGCSRMVKAKYTWLWALEIWDKKVLNSYSYP